MLSFTSRLFLEQFFFLALTKKTTKPFRWYIETIAYGSDKERQSEQTKGKMKERYMAEKHISI